MVGRTAELKYLQQLYKKSGNQLLVLYGRTDIGKTELLNEFCKEKRTLYYTARQASPQQQMQMMGDEIQDFYGIKMPEYSYDIFFNRIRSGDSSKLLFIIHGFDRIVKKDPTFMDSIVKLFHHMLYPGQIMILLCSSSIVWVENDMVECLGVHAKQLTGVYKIKELDFVDIVHSFPHYTVRECVEVYGVLGGVSGFLKRWNELPHSNNERDTKADIRRHICMHIITRNGFLHHEAERYLSKELRELSVYNTILAAIAAGMRKLNVLHQYTGYSRAKISVYLKNLMEFEIVEKVFSFETGGWQNAQKGLYQISNTFINFWYRFIYPHMSSLSFLTAEEFYDAYIQSELKEYLERYFVQVCWEYLELMGKVGGLPIQIYKIGTWVGKQDNIDIVVQNSIRENLVGMCNWSEKEFTFEKYQALLSAMEQARIQAKKYYLFSATVFDERITAAANENDQIVLVDMTRL